MFETIEDVVAQLRRDPSHPVRAVFGGLTVEVRAVLVQSSDKSAADVFAEIGPWAGETTEEILTVLSEARRPYPDRPDLTRWGLE